MSFQVIYLLRSYFLKNVISLLGKCGNEKLGSQTAYLTWLGLGFVGLYLLQNVQFGLFTACCFAQQFSRLFLEDYEKDLDLTIMRFYLFFVFLNVRKTF